MTARARHFERNEVESRNLKQLNEISPFRSATVEMTQLKNF